MKYASGNVRGHAPREVLRWPTERSRDWTSTFINSARVNRGIEAVVAIGSADRPHVPSADLDLIVIQADTASLRERPPLEIDLRDYSAVNVDAQLAGGNDLLGAGVKFGKALYHI